jgi:metal iron transporter
VAAVVGNAGIGQLLVASQVVLSVVLPFMVLPLVWLTSNKSIMSVKKPVSTTVPVPANVRDSEQGEEVEIVDFSIGRVTTICGYLVWLTIVIANSYVLIMLCIGSGS